MPNDVLDTLMRLPPVCAVWTGEQGFLIKRGVMGMVEYPLATKNDVSEFNTSHNVTPEQERAMMCGCVNGWDAEGARVQTSSDSDPIFIYAATFILMLSVQAPTEDAAAKVAHSDADEVGNVLSKLTGLPNTVLTLTRDGKELDLIEEHKP